MQCNAAEGNPRFLNLDQQGNRKYTLFCSSLAKPNQLNPVLSSTRLLRLGVILDKKLTGESSALAERAANQSQLLDPALTHMY